MYYFADPLKPLVCDHSSDLTSWPSFTCSLTACPLRCTQRCFSSGSLVPEPDWPPRCAYAAYTRVVTYPMPLLKTALPVRMLAHKRVHRSTSVLLP